MENLVLLRKELGLTQTQAAAMFGISMRSYQDYETDKSKAGTIKYNYFINKFKEMLYVDENTGLLTIEKIKTICSKIFKNYDVKSCYLFGSYAKHKETPKSDVDLLVDTSVSGIDFYALCEVLRESLHKKVDLLDIKRVSENHELLSEILKDGIKIYG